MEKSGPLQGDKESVLSEKVVQPESKVTWGNEKESCSALHSRLSPRKEFPSISACISAPSSLRKKLYSEKQEWEGSCFKQRPKVIRSLYSWGPLRKWKDQYYNSAVSNHFDILSGYRFSNRNYTELCYIEKKGHIFFGFWKAYSAPLNDFNLWMWAATSKL